MENEDNIKDNSSILFLPDEGMWIVNFAPT